MTIHEFEQKIKLYLNDIKDRLYGQEKGLKIKDDLYIVIMIMLVGTASFGLGKISSYEKDKKPISILKTQEYMLATVWDGASSVSNTKINDTPNTAANVSPNQQTRASGEVVASKSGTKYYYPWCTGVSRIKEENKVWFNSIEDARLVGLTPATNCAGLK